MLRIYFLLLPVIMVSCSQVKKKDPVVPENLSITVVYKTIGAIPEPGGFTKVAAAPGSFTAWLREIPLKKDKRVYLYNGLLKSNQSAQFAVLDISIGNKDLQQCADAVMGLRAEYLYSQKKFAEMVRRE